MASASPAPVRLMLELAPGSSPIAGAVGVEGAEPRPFSGWIDLIAALQEAAVVDGAERDRP